jgi:hypothetical protein
MNRDTDLAATARVAALAYYPIKGCGAIACESADLLATGLRHDREWMVVDARDTFITQRTDPALARVRLVFERDMLIATAAGQEVLAIDLTRQGEQRTVRVWQSTCAADDAGTDAAHWFSSLLGKSVRLVRFASGGTRQSNPEWTGGRDAPVYFPDGYAVLVTVNASLAALNERLAVPLPMTRFRPNVVLDGLTAWAEDDITTLAGDSASLELVKPCVRCAVTTVDQESGVMGVEPLPTLKKLRWSRALKGVTFGVNAIVTRPGTLRVGETLQIQRRTRDA